MRVVNDREEKTTEPSDLGMLQMFSYALFCAAGISTVLFSPVPMILAHLRLTDTQAKISGLLGALIALTFLEIPLNLVVLTFVFGLFVADSVARERNLWLCLAGGGILGLLAATGMLSIEAVGQQMSVVPYWRELVHGSVEHLKSVQNGAIDLAQLESLLLYEGPFLFVSVTMLSFWLSVGLIAHLGWFPETHAMTAESLRRKRLPAWIVPVFVTLLAGTVIGPEWSQRLASGLVRLTGTLLFIQGCMVLSQVMHRREARPRVRTLVYTLSVVFGFYALVVMGLVGPWVARLREKAAAGLEVQRT